MDRPLKAALTLLALFGPLSGCRHGEPPTGRPEASRGASSEEIAAVAVSKPRSTRSDLAGRWWRDDVFYEVFVRSFADSDGDGVGDFRGLSGKLDALVELGVNGLWLMPIHPSPSYHGYDVTDYRAVNPDYGTEADFDAFLAAAHERGLRVIIDFVLNHSSSQHPWFLESGTGEASRLRDWYVWRPAPDPRFRRPWDGSLDIWHPGPSGHYYGLFWSGMPDLNLANPKVEAEMIESMRFWLERGVDGFRVDAVRYLVETEDGANADTPETHAVLKRLRAALAESHPEALLVAEAWTDRAQVAPYYGVGGDEMQLAFGFDSASAIMQAAKDGLRVSVARSARELTEVFEDPNFVAPFLTNHDMPRAMQAFENARATSAARAAAATLFAWPGTPFIYYGEEIGMRGGPSRADEDKRTPMRWEEGPGFGFTTGTPWRASEEPAGVDVASQRADPKSLWNLYRALIGLRRSEPALSDGSLSVPALSGASRGLVALLREAGQDRMLFVTNFHEEPSPSILLTRVSASRAVVRFAEGLRGDVEVTKEGLRLPALSGRGFAFIRLAD